MEKSKGKKPVHALRGSSLLLVLLLGLVHTAAVWQKSSTKPSLQLRVEGLKNSKGLVRITMFNTAEGFPGDREKAVKLLSVPAVEAGVEVNLTDLPAGTYAIAILHDENQNGELDTNFIGYPTEGYGASNNYLPTFRAPTFSEAAFKLTQEKQNLVIRLRY